MTNHRPRWRPYLQYLERLALSRTEPIPDIVDDETYWRRREQCRADQQKADREDPR
jgi:hypothetical protein